MGYRSEVGIALKESDFNILVANAKEESFDYAYDLIKCADDLTKVDEIVVIHFVWVKWYEEYSDVSYIENFLHEKADGYGFVRIGENDNDIETNFVESKDGEMFYDYIDVMSQISITEGEPITI